MMNSKSGTGLFSAMLYLSALLSGLMYWRPQQVLFAALVWVPKLVAGTLAPVLALVGAVGVGLGLWRREWKWVISGALGAGLSIRYIDQIQTPHDDFEQVFGPDWQEQVPEALRQNWLPRRWSPFVRSRGRAVRENDIVFGHDPISGDDLLANLWLPPLETPRNGLALIYVHGGAWIYGDKDEGPHPFFRHLTGQGYAVLDIAYTLWPKSGIAEMANEVKQGVLWLKQNGPAYGINPERIVLVGGSAGAHLSLLAAYTPNHPAFQPEQDSDNTVTCVTDTSVRGVVAFYPPTDFISMYEDSQAALGHLTSGEGMNTFEKLLLRGMARTRYIPVADQKNPKLDFITALLGGAPSDLPETYRLLSPIAHVGPQCPPTLLLQGTDDFFRLAPAVRRLHHALRAVDVPSILVEFPHTEHAFDLPLPQLSPAAQSATYDVERFLALLV